MKSESSSSMCTMAEKRLISAFLLATANSSGSFLTDLLKLLDSLHRRKFKVLHQVTKSPVVPVSWYDASCATESSQSKKQATAQLDCTIQQPRTVTYTSSRLLKVSLCCRLDDIKLQEGLCTPQDDKTSMETLAGLRGGISIASHSEEVDQDHQRYTGSLWSSDEDEYVYDEDEAVDIYADDEDDEDEEVEEDEEDIDIYTDDIDYEPETRKHHDVNELGEGDNSQPTDAGEVQHALMDSMASFSGHLTAEIEDSRS